MLYLLLCHVTVWQTCLSWHQRHCGASMLHTSNLCAFQTAKVLNSMKYLFMKNCLPVNSSVSCWFIASSLQYIEETPYSPFLSESEWFGASLSTARLSDRKPNPWLTGLLPATDRYLVTCCHISVNRYSSHFENAIHMDGLQRGLVCFWSCRVMLLLFCSYLSWSMRTWQFRTQAEWHPHIKLL